MNRLFFRTPPEEWMEGLPIGNGRLAGMVWGDKIDRLTLNHEWLWTGRNKGRSVQQAAEALPLVRQYIREGDHFMATALTNAFYATEGGHGRVDDYQPAGEFDLELIGDAVFKSRELDIRRGVATICRSLDESIVSAEFFADCVGSCISACWSSKKQFSAALSLIREEEKGTELDLTVQSRCIRLNGSISGGIRFAVKVDIDTDGQTSIKNSKLFIENATIIQCTINMATSQRSIEEELSQYCIDAKNYLETKNTHTTRFSELMERIDFSLQENEALAELTTDERISKVKQGYIDNSISCLYFNYGRYLLISSSVCGELPANLQGKWNDSLTPPWNCDYHFDINLEMNYWMAEPANMAECANALIKYIRSFMKSGREAAMKMYGCRGIIIPIQTDAWGISTSESYGWAAWIGAAPWIARHLWDHYRYSGDVNYLKNDAYEIFTAIAEFYEDYLQKDDKGIYQILPSQSPENTIIEIKQFPVLIDQSSAMDVQLCYDALGYAIQSAEILGIDADKVVIWKQIRDNLPPFSIGSDGRLMEWQKEYSEAEPGHRHLSHLYGVYPSDIFTPDTRPEQYNAAIRSLEYRLSHGGGHTGWSRAWTSCMLARLGDENGFYEHYTALVKDFATISLLDLCGDVYQIDGNFGGVAAVLESIVSYYDNTAHILRALPRQWSNGHMNGVRIPGGHIINIAWKDSVLTSLTVKIGFEPTACLEWNGSRFIAEGKASEIIKLI